MRIQLGRQSVGQKKMCDKLIHRGPDQQGVYLDKGISLGHTRLSILDLSEKGRQPMTDKEGGIAIVFNGEIYNYRELKEEYLGEFDFKSKTDTEVLIYMYKKFGKGLLKYINGRFAFCIYDRKRKIFFLARDRLGMNPLYYYWNKEKFLFASELKAIVEDDGIIRKVDMNAVYHYLQYGYTPQEESILEGIKKLPPAHFMEFDLKREEIKIERYWELDFSEKIHISEKEAIKRIRQLMSESVKKKAYCRCSCRSFFIRRNG